jgi:tetratricopeptide (TPR) repeat protein
MTAGPEVGDASLLARLLSVDPADRERLVRLEPAYRRLSFVDAVLEAASETPTLWPVAFELLRRTADLAPELLSRYAYVTFLMIGQAPDDRAGTERLLAELELAAHRGADLLVGTQVQWRRLVDALADGDPPRIGTIALALAGRTREIAAQSIEAYPQPARQAVVDSLHEAAMVAYYQAGDVPATLRLTQAALRLTDAANTLRLAAVAHLRLGHADDARAMFVRLTASDQALGSDFFNLGNLLSQTPDRAGATEAFGRAAAFNAQDALFALRHAVALASEGRHDEADAAVRRAVPLCATMIEADGRLPPEERRSFSSQQGVRQTLAEQILLMRLQVLDLSIEADRTDLARGQLEVLASEGAGGSALTHGLTLGLPRDVTQARMAGILWRERDRDGALRLLDDLVDAGRDDTSLRLWRARWRWEQGRADEALDDLARVSRTGVHEEDAIALLREMRERLPDRPEILKWLGCALAHPNGDHRLEGIAILDRVLARDPDDSWALYRRGVARLALDVAGGLDRAPETAELFLAMKDLGRAAANAPRDETIRHAWRWLIDRLACDGMWLIAIDESGDRPGGVGTVAPVAAAAMRELRVGRRLGEGKQHGQAIEKLRAAQACLVREGFPILGLTCDLLLADNLLRLHDLESAAIHLQAYERRFVGECARPLTRSLESQVDRLHREHDGSLTPLINYELEFMHIQQMAAQAHQVPAMVLAAELLSRMGRDTEAAAAIEPIERALLDGTAPDHLVGGVENIAIILRNAGYPDRALAVVERVRPRADDRAAFKLDFFRGTLLMYQGQEQAAAEVFEQLLARKADVAPAHDGIEFNLAGLYGHLGQPERGWALLAPLLEKPPASDRFALLIHVNAKQLRMGLGDLEGGLTHARAVLTTFTRMRSALASIEDRQLLAGEHAELIDDVLRTFADAGRADELFAAVETLRARSWEEEQLHRLIPSDTQVQVLDGQIARLDRIATLLRRLHRGIARMGPGHHDTTALAELRVLDPQLKVFERQGDETDGAEPPLSPALIERHQASCDRDLARLKTDRARQGVASGSAASPAREAMETTPDGLSQALHRSLQRTHEGARRCVFIHLVALGRDLIPVRVASDDHAPRLLSPLRWPDGLPALGDPGVSGEALADLVEALDALDEVNAGGSLPGDDDRRSGWIAPLLTDLAPGDHVVLCTTGAVSRLPWHAMAVDGAPWCERNPISFAPSATALVRCLSLPWPTGAPLVVGDPTGDLPRGRDEARAVAEVLGVKPLLGSTATTGLVRAALTDATPAWLHFACHGDVDQADATRSALLLAPEDPSDDGRLTMAALGAVTLTGTRAVLSACDTAVSDGPTTMEVFGMPRAMLAAGARAVIASLWKADDTATQLLMQHCYQLLPSMSLAQAMAQAQGWLRTLSVADVIAWAEAALADDPPPDQRARLLRHIAVEQVRADDRQAAAGTLKRLLAEVDEGQAAAEHAQARRYLALLTASGEPLAAPDYGSRPFAPTRTWAPFVVMGDWR